MSMMRARVRGHRWVDHPAAAVMKARVPGQWVDCPAAVVMEAREQGRCWIDHPAVAVMEARVQGRHWVDRPSVGTMPNITILIMLFDTDVVNAIFSTVIPITILMIFIFNSRNEPEADRDDVSVSKSIEDKKVPAAPSIVIKSRENKKGPEAQGGVRPKGFSKAPETRGVVKSQGSNNLPEIPSVIKSRGKGPARGSRIHGRAQGGGRGPPGRPSRARSESQRIDYVTKRLLSAGELKMKELQNQLQEMRKHLQVVKDENRLFKNVQHKHQRALKKFEDTESQLPQLLKNHSNEVRSLREQLRHTREKHDKTDRYLRDAEDELDRANAQLKKYKGLSEQKNPGERSELDRRLNKVESTLEEKNSKIRELERHLEMVKKNHRHELGTERARDKEAQKQIDLMTEEKARLEVLVKEKEKQLEAQNIYSNRLLVPAGTYSGTPPHTPPLWRQSLMKQSESLTDVSSRDKAKAYEEKRRAADAEKKEKRAKSQEPKKTPPKKTAEEQKEKAAAETSQQPQREDSEGEFWRRQEERYKQDQTNRDRKEEEEEEEAAKLREERERLKRDLEEKERAERERREAAQRERREREQKEDTERKEREERERGQKEREERERKEAEERATQRREEEIRAREEEERLEREARLAEEQRKKEELLRRLQQLGGSGDKTQPSGDPFAPHDSPSRRGGGGEPFAPSPSKRKDYIFTQSVENLHKGKPSHDHKNDDSDIGGYQPSFVSPLKTNTTTMKQKKPLSLFDDDADPKPAANLGGADKKSRLMADLFGGSRTSDTKKTSDGDDLFLSGSRAAAAPRQPMQNKRAAAAFPWDGPLPPSNRPREGEKRESSALFGGGAAVVVDDREEAMGNGGPRSKHLLPRRPRQTNTTTFSSKPAVLAVDNFDDDIEEVVL
ncbi:hypothetical protein ACOMHN_050237 [Nucella lapillus]